MASRRSSRRHNRAPYRPPSEPKFLFQGLGSAVARAYGRAGPGSHRYTAAAQAAAKILEQRGLELSGGRPPSARRVQSVMIGYGLHPERRRRRAQELAEQLGRPVDPSEIEPAHEGLAEATTVSRRHIRRGVQELVDEGLVTIAQLATLTGRRCRGRYTWLQRLGGCLTGGVGNANEYQPGPVLLGLQPPERGVEPEPPPEEPPPDPDRESFAAALERIRWQRRGRL